jgi:hypothetical protein
MALGLSSPHSFARIMITSMVSNLYLNPFGLRFSRNSQSFAYKLPTSKIRSTGVLHFISTSFGFLLASATKRIPEVGLFFSYFKKALNTNREIILLLM